MIFKIINTNLRSEKFRVPLNLKLTLTIILIFVSICNVSFSQGRRGLGTYSDFKYELNDSIRKKLADSLGIGFDSTYFQPVDSTSRIKFFQYHPTYSYNSKIKEKTHPLLLGNSSAIKIGRAHV